MATYNEQLQRIWRRYEAEVTPTPAQAKEVAAWAYEQKLLQPRRSDIIARFAEDFSRALREEYRTDKQGRRYRAKHVVRLVQGGQQSFLWADMATAPRGHMEKAFAQRRQQIVGDCHQLRTDVDVYNDSHPTESPVQLLLDFTKDVEELQCLERRPEDEAA